MRSNLILGAALVLAASSITLAQDGRRPLTRAEVTSCNPQFERVKEVVVRAHPVFIEELKARPPRPGTQFSINLYERQVAEAKSKGALDFWWENAGDKSTVGFDAANTNRELRQHKETLAAMKAGDEAKMNAIIGIVPQGLHREHRIIHAEANVCVLEIRREFLRTGKVPGKSS